MKAKPTLHRLVGRHADFELEVMDLNGLLFHPDRRDMDIGLDYYNLKHTILSIYIGHNIRVDIDNYGVDEFLVSAIMGHTK